MDWIRSMTESCISCLYCPERDFDLSDVGDYNYYYQGTDRSNLISNQSNDIRTTSTSSINRTNLTSQSQSQSSNQISLDEYCGGEDGVDFKLSRWDLFLTWASIIFRKNLVHVNRIRLTANRFEEDEDSTSLMFLENESQQDASLLDDVSFLVELSKRRGKRNDQEEEGCEPLIDLSTGNDKDDQELGRRSNQESKVKSSITRKRSSSKPSSTKNLRSGPTTTEEVGTKLENDHDKTPKRAGSHKKLPRPKVLTKVKRLNSLNSPSSSSSSSSLGSSMVSKRTSLNDDLFSNSNTTSSRTTVDRIFEEVENEDRSSERVVGGRGRGRGTSMVMDSEVIKFIHRNYNSDCRKMFGCDLSRAQIQQIYDHLLKSSQEEEEFDYEFEDLGGGGGGIEGRKDDDDDDDDSYRVSDLKNHSKKENFLNNKLDRERFGKRIIPSDEIFKRVICNQT